MLRIPLLVNQFIKLGFSGIVVSFTYVFLNSAYACDDTEFGVRPLERALATASATDWACSLR